jgi:hypothetical protein
MLTGPIGAGLQNLYRSIAALPGTLQSLGGGLAPGLLHAGASTGSTGGPYQTLFEGSIANLQTLGTGISANPAPFLHQIVTSTTGYANTIAGDLQNFPTLLAASPTNIQAGLQGLPAAFQSAGHQLITGAIGGALSDVTGGFPGLFVNGVDVTATGDVFTPAGVNAGVGLTGASADLNPIPTLPVLRAQYLTNLLPPGSVAAHVSQNVTNALTDTSLTARALVPIAPAVRPPFLVVNAPFNATAGLPTALGINALGGPINALDTTSAGLAQFGGQVQTGDPLGVITTLADSPAYIANAFLNGQSALPLT